MKKSIPCWQMVGFIVTAVLGTLLHFLFDWARQNILAAVFSAVNESIWEHRKLLFYPMFLFAMLEYHFWGKKYINFWCIKLMGKLFGLTLIPVIYYTYTGISGISADWFNVTIFFIAAGAAFWLETKLFQKVWSCPMPSGVALALLFLISVVFTVLTFVPPHIPYFRDPLTGTYGFQK